MCDSAILVIVIFNIVIIICYDIAIVIRSYWD